MVLYGTSSPQQRQYFASTEDILALVPDCIFKRRSYHSRGELSIYVTMGCSTGSWSRRCHPAANPVFSGFFRMIHGFIHMLKERRNILSISGVFGHAQADR